MKVYDKDIRSLLLKEIVKKQEYVSDPTCIVVHEMDVCFGCARIDIAVINDRMHGYEIKSERDNLERLPFQIEFYNKAFDTITLVVSENHCAKAAKIIPKWWGLYCAIKDRREPSLQVIRHPSRNSRVEALTLAQILWKEELRELLTVNGVTKGVKNKTRYELGEMAAKEVGYSELASFVRNKLKNRDWRALPIRQLCDDLHLS